ncbi:unnamed protein product [Aureobasidium uvarum]|uniref:Uncharacterized protein n=1 Tax=Aureobasidium uvarum TaxID=2773716 RepID=A0A9N8PR55_9PEZI|nr:unnamed protein product [Aureobasidium uvarum]
MHLEDHAAAEETEKSTAQLAKVAETAITAAVAADPVATRTIAPMATTNPAPRAVGTATVREKRNALIATEATVIVNALVEIARPQPMEPTTITRLPAAHVATTQHPQLTTKDSRSRALALAANLSLLPPVPVKTATTTRTPDALACNPSSCPKTLPLRLQTPTPRNVKHVSKSAWPKNSNAAKVPLWEKEVEAMKQEDGDPLRRRRGRREEEKEEKVSYRYEDEEGEEARAERVEREREAGRWG